MQDDSPEMGFRYTILCQGLDCCTQLISYEQLPIRIEGPLKKNSLNFGLHEWMEESEIVVILAPTLLEIKMCALETFRPG